MRSSNGRWGTGHTYRCIRRSQGAFVGIGTGIVPALGARRGPWRLLAALAFEVRLGALPDHAAGGLVEVAHVEPLGAAPAVLVLGLVVPGSGGGDVAAAELDAGLEQQDVARAEQAHPAAVVRVVRLAVEERLNLVAPAVVQVVVRDRLVHGDGAVAFGQGELVPWLGLVGVRVRCRVARGGRGGRLLARLTGCFGGTAAASRQ